MGKIALPDGSSVNIFTISMLIFLLIIFFFQEYVAVKELLTMDEEAADVEKNRQTFKREINLMKSMHAHENVLKVIIYHNYNLVF
jgi:serine/threonine protein kinase